jgi:predicted ATPase
VSDPNTIWVGIGVAPRKLLSPVYGWFAVGFHTRDLKEAKALLEELVAA